MDQQYIVLQKDDPLSWALMPHAIKRIKEFCLKYQTDTNPAELAELVQQHFIAPVPLMLVAVAFEKGKGVFAHALACIEDITGNRFLTIMQLESDQPMNQEAVKQIYEKFRMWGLRHNAGEATLVTMDEAHARLFKRFYGFRKHRFLMRKPLLED